MKKALLAVGIVVIFLSCFTSNLLAVDGWASKNGGTTGGGSLTPIDVSTAAAFKTNVESASPCVVRVSGTIDLGSVGGGVNITSNKTIMGLNTSSTIKGRLGFTNGSSNIIIQGLNITNPSYAEADGISVKQTITNLFITKCNVYDCGDGCIDITNASDFVTVSWCKFYYTSDTGHNFVNLFSSSDNQPADVNKLRITFHHNWWSTLCKQRMPRGRYGKVHVYNNYYSCTGNDYCIGVGKEAQLRVESNYFDNVNTTWYNPATIPGIIGWNSDNQFVNGTTIPTTYPNDYATIFEPNYYYALDAGADVKSLVMACAGNVTCGGSPPGAASSPVPSNGATDVSLTQDLSWTAGTGATSRDVYFGTVNPPVTKVIADGTALTYDTGTMATSTTYYWRVDEKNTSGTTTGTVWNFTTVPLAPGAASSPIPTSGTTDVSRTQDLSWTAGSGAASHDVYFGTVNPPPSIGNQADTTYDTGTMASITTYYWRIDEKNAGGTTTGSVWNFTTQDTTPPAAPTGLTATAGYIPVVLDWNNNSESDLAGYNVYRSTTSGSGYGKLNGTLLTDSNYIDDINTTDIIYYYVVTAADTSSNESDDSNEVYSGLYGDFTGNKIISLNDLAEFVTYWLSDNCTETAGVDLDEDCIVNFDEFAAFADNWLIE